MKKTLIIISLLIAIPSFVLAQEARLSVRDGGGATTFEVQASGAMTIDGEDATNNFNLKVLGKANGDTHTQIITDEASSRLTILASTADDQAPRLQVIGPEDPTANAGTALFDFGSSLIDLPDAGFRIRYNDTNGNQDMLRIFGPDSVTFPQSEVLVGIRTDDPFWPLQIGETGQGAYSNGTQWIDASTREAKDNIAELNREEALETLRKMTAVKFSYKADAHNETNVGFIAEDVPELVATQDRKGMVSMEVVAVLTKVVQEQQEMITKLNAEVQSLKDRM